MSVERENNWEEDINRQIDSIVNKNSVERVREELSEILHSHYRQLSSQSKEIDRLRATSTDVETLQVVADVLTSKLQKAREGLAWTIDQINENYEENEKDSFIKVIEKETQKTLKELNDQKGGRDGKGLSNTGEDIKSVAQGLGKGI